MSLSITYFGMIAEATGSSSERLASEGNETVGKLRETLVSKYPTLSELEFKIAVDSNVVEDNEKLQDGALIALLPPFAGG